MDLKFWNDVFVTGLDPNGEMFIGDIRNQYEFLRITERFEGNIILISQSIRV